MEEKRKQDRCNVCGKFINAFKAWNCETCDKEHHPECSGDNYNGSAPYPDEDSYSICQVCVNESHNKIENIPSEVSGNSSHK